MEEKEKSTCPKYVSLTKKQRNEHFAVVLYLSIYALIPTIFILIELFFTNKNEKSLFLSGGWIFVLIMGLLVAAVYWDKKRGLRYKRVDIIYVEEEFQEAVSRTQTQLNWIVRKNEPKFFKATSYEPLETSKDITILKRPGYLLLNNITESGNNAQIDIWNGKNENIKVFLFHLKDVVNDRPRRIKKEPFKAFIVQFFACLMSLFFIAIGIFFIVHAENPREIGTIILIPVIGLGYLIFYIRSFFVKRKKH